MNKGDKVKVVSGQRLVGCTGKVTHVYDRPVNGKPQIVTVWVNQTETRCNFFKQDLEVTK